MVRDLPTTFFPELEGAERDRADEWLHEYLRLVVRIHHEHLTGRSSELSTPTLLTEPQVLTRSVRSSEEATNHSL